jgi:hypothetical protein
MSRFVFPGACLLLATTLFGTLQAWAQAVVDARTEVITSYSAPMNTSMSQRDGAPVMMSGINAAGSIRSILEEVELITVAFQISGFDPNDLGSHLYHVGMFSESGNGSGTAYPDRNGYVEFELPQRPGMELMKTFLYSVHVETGTVEVFIDQRDLSLNEAVMLLTNLQMNARPLQQRFSGFDPERTARMSRHLSQGLPEIGQQRRLGLYGEYLSLEDLQEQIFQQTRCNVELDVDVFYLASCD